MAAITVDSQSVSSRTSSPVFVDGAQDFGIFQQAGAVLAADTFQLPPQTMIQTQAQQRELPSPHQLLELTSQSSPIVSPGQPIMTSTHNNLTSPITIMPTDSFSASMTSWASDASSQDSNQSYGMSGCPISDLSSSTSQVSPNYATAFSGVDTSTDAQETSHAGPIRSKESKAEKAKRKRIITRDQRRAANVRERRRMVTLNDAFDHLKQRIPTFSHEKKLSRIETLRLAMAYINFMKQLLENPDSQNMAQVELNYSQSSMVVDPSLYKHANYTMATEQQPCDVKVALDPQYFVDQNTDPMLLHHHGYYQNAQYQ